MKSTEVEVYEDKGGEFRWRLRARNGRIIADSAEGYVSRRNAARAWHATATSIRSRPVVRHVGVRRRTQ